MKKKGKMHLRTVRSLSQNGYGIICFGNGWKLIKMNFSSNFFLKVDLIGFFRELHVRKFRKFSPDHFYDENFQFYDKKTDFRPGMEISSETTIPGISSETAAAT